MKIITNNQWRELLTFEDLTEKEQKDWREYESSGVYLFRYKNAIYTLNEFLRISCKDELFLKGWHGYYQDSAFSGIIIAIDEEGGRVKLGYAIS